MNSEREPNPTHRASQASQSAKFASQVDQKAKRKIKAKRNRDTGVWFGLGMMGLIGWSVVLPTLAGTAVGMWLDHRFPRSQSWTLMLLVAGLLIGCFNAWMWVSKEDKAMHEEKEDDNE
ncbi:Putative F0F1-ATPase subunit (ATPase_gene1) [Rubripirellula lacrimiformis]|uniref:F0F1-ATPase subunit (ATPase_gene1) n=1 Tax=Rubripirellula lacrimiformis TaxID=1930273 RepID=A0A517NIK8_9BACT|nr:AtpZ/AtpI family protein [Rubripirellula lacrimiformis]QDT06964.1 Putative F0F1-ATPase subunit (ATPase_gene1) [Rubripirellula lacrimiformis]